MRKLLFVIVCFAILFVATIIHAEELNEQFIGDFVYIVENNEIHILQYTGNDSVVIVPDYIDGMPVVSVKFSPATYPEDPNTGNNTVSKVILPSTVKTLDAYAFNSYQMLQEVEGLENIEHICEGAFAECWKIHELVFSKNLRYIDTFAFRNLRYLTRIVIPDDVIYGEGPFGINIYALETVELIRGNHEATLVNIDQVIYSADRSTLILYLPMKQTLCFRVPDSVTRLMRYSFENIQSAVYDYLYEVIIPQSVIKIDSFYNVTQDTFRILVYEDSYAYRYLSENYGGELNIVIVDPDMNLEDVSAVTMLDTIIDENTTPDMSEYQIALALHDWILDHATYDDSLEYFSALDILLYGTGVCESYSELYRDLLNKAGITNALVQTFNHQFNAVRIDGDWCYIDCTWDDASDTSNEFLRHKYFGYSKSLLIDIFQYEVAHYEAFATHHYWYMEGYLDTAIDQLSELINQKLENNVSGFDVNLNPAILDIETKYSGMVVASVLSKRVWITNDGMIRLSISFEYTDDGCCQFKCLIIPDDEDPGDFVYELNAEENGWTVIAYTGDDIDIVIPDEYLGLPVTSVSNGAFKNCFTKIETIIMPKYATRIADLMFLDWVCLKTVKFPEKLKYIGWYSFANCYSLKEAKLPDTVKYISAGAFSRCYALSCVRIPAGAEIRDAAFEHCKALTTLELSEGIRSIPSNAFYGCLNLDNVQLPSSLESIYNGAFALTGLTRIDLPSNLSTICGNPFYGCEMIKINIASDNGYYTEKNGLLVDQNNKIICAEAGIIRGDYIIESDINGLDDYAFSYNDALTSITIPSSVKHIGMNAFEYCEHLRNIVIQEGVLTIGKFAFSCTFATYLSLPDSIIEIGTYAFYACHFDSFTIPYSMTSLNETIVDWSIPLHVHKNVTDIGEWFLYLNQETMMIYGEPGSFAELYATENGFPFTAEVDDYVTSTIFLPDFLTIIEEEAFYGIAATAVVIPSSVTDIIGNPFAGSAVTTIYGYIGSAAERFVDEYPYYTFIPIDDE